ncbi:hypothetical protein JR316_0007926 [Psilocybe cubensis]|uniref:Uncharacterized protein n=2 Tax=Psilocybe cubensis TaxID=181762 RepID=A0ACB8GVT2_PSICU|nr:hypothetical protein JR316_0007926 [Psilocybe cubensis]KAH9479336.1 hypothetical protein JR316_0007926 [Psilocybe cubensis]
MSVNQPQPQRVHEEFDFNDADVVFSSSDNVLFRLHRKNLELLGEIFPGGEFSADGEVVHLQEPSKRRKRLDDLGHVTLADVAEAAEKYRMYTAMDACEMRLEAILPVSPSLVLAHALKHNIPKLINASARQMCLWNVQNVFRGRVPNEYVVPWGEYHTCCQEILFDKLTNFVESHLNASKYDENDQACAITSAYWFTKKLRSRPTPVFTSIQDRLFWNESLREHTELTPTCPYIPTAEAVSEGGPETCWIHYEIFDFLMGCIREVNGLSFTSFIEQDRKRTMPMDWY